MLKIERSTIVVSTPYNADFVDNLKAVFDKRRFDWDTKSWLLPASSDNLHRLTPMLKLYYDYEIPQELFSQVGTNPQVEVKNFTIYYLGLPRTRNDDSESSFATTKMSPESGDYAAWNVVFPLEVLRKFFDGDNTNVPRERQNYFQVLGLSKGAKYKEIKKKYHLMAKTYHPDVSDHSQAEDFFKLINEAYQVLGDKKKRNRYLAAMEISQHQYKTEKHSAVIDVGWYPPIKAGQVQVEAKENISRWYVSKIIDWQPILDTAGRQMIPFFRDGKIQVKWS